MKRTIFIILLLLVFTMLLPGCYATPQEKVPAEDAPSTSGDEQATEPESEAVPESVPGHVDVKTYPLPEENRDVASFYTHYCPASQGGYYFCSGEYLTYKDIHADIPVKMCPQEGCEHNDSSCAAYMGGSLQNLVEYRGALYAVVKTKEDLLRLVRKDLSDGSLKVYGEWVASEVSDEQSSHTDVYMYPPSGGKLYYYVYHDVYDMNTGEQLSVEEATYSLDLLTEKVEQFPLDGFWTSGEAGFVVTVSEYSYDEATDDETLTNCEVRLYDPSATSYTLIASKVRDGYIPTGDPSQTYGTKFCYQCENTLYTLDADTGESTALVTPEDRVVNYWLMDNKIFYITNDKADKAYFYYADLNDCIPVQLYNCGNTDCMVFGMSSEGNDYFAANWKVLSKEDFYAENYGE